MSRSLSSTASTKLIPSGTQTLLSAIMASNQKNNLSTSLAPLRWVLFLLGMVSYRALPGVLQLKLLALRVRQMLDFRMPFTDAATSRPRRRHSTSSSSPSSSSHNRSQISSLAFQGENPFDVCITYKTVAALSDTDYNGVLSTTAYSRALDYARMRAAIICFPSVLDARGWLGLGDSQFCFIKEIPLNTQYEIRINIGGWDDKWLYLIAQYVTYPNGRDQYDSDTEPTPTAAATTSQLPTPSTTRSQTRSSSSSPSSSSSTSPVLAYTPPVYTTTDGVYVQDEMAYRNESDRTHTHAHPNESESTSYPFPSPPHSHSHPMSHVNEDASRSRSVSSSSFSTQSSYDAPSLFDSDDHDREDDIEEEDEDVDAGGEEITSPTQKNSLGLDLETPSPLFSLPTPPRTPSNANPTFNIQSSSSFMPPIPSGAHLHAIHTSSYCFKHGHLTIPPRVALSISGFGSGSIDLDQQEQERIERVAKIVGRCEEIDGTKTRRLHMHHHAAATDKRNEESGMEGLLRSGWRYFDGNSKAGSGSGGVWDMKELQAEREDAVRKFVRLRDEIGRVNNTSARR